MSSGLLRIGQVCERIRDEFPDISISKLRFLEDRGIVTPTRTPAGYRMYSDDDVADLRAALRMQRDEFMPLKVIRRELERRLAEGASAEPMGADSPRAAATTADPSAFDDGPAVALVGESGTDDHCSELAVARAASTTVEFVAACRSSDLVAGRPDGHGSFEYSADEVRIVQLAAAMDALGFDLRQLRQVAHAMGRQASMVDRYALPMLRSASSETREHGAAAVESLTRALVEYMRVAFVREVKLSVERATMQGSSTTIS